MKSLFEILNKKIYVGTCSVMAALCVIANATAANVVARPTAQTASSNRETRPTMAARMPTMTITPSASISTSSQPTPEPEPATETVTESETPTVENKSSVFGSTLTKRSASESDIAAATLAELVRAQRAALDAADAESVTATTRNTVSGNGENTCDTMLRECMIQKCGSNFAKCVGDTDTTFGDKLDTCRRTTKCTGREYTLFAAEIKADRDFNAKLANYNATIDCGNRYDTCIVSECGATFSKCIGKSAGDNAISKCSNIAKSCTEYDSGLAMRAMGVFAEFRQDAERQISVDEKRLYALRDEMRSLCSRLGAMFDERSLDCVYTVNFRAGDDSTLFASKKAYAGSTFDCTQNWFGIDTTTFRENAYRETRAQTSASGAMLGSGLGQAVGALTSGAIDRAIDRYTAENALNEKIKECMETHGISESECRAKIGGANGDGDNTGDGGTGGANSTDREMKQALAKAQQEIDKATEESMAQMEQELDDQLQKDIDAVLQEDIQTGTPNETGASQDGGASEGNSGTSGGDNAGGASGGTGGASDNSGQQ